jgi:hypothetical protein
MKALLPGTYPGRGCQRYAEGRRLLELAAAYGLHLSGAENARTLLEQTIAAGFGAEYFPALAKVVGSK